MSEGIAYQNKDIISKVFTEYFGCKSLEVYGLHIPKVMRLLPTNLPAIEANEWRIDNLLDLQDGSIGILDYESDYREEDKSKYLNYMSRVYRKMVKDGKGDKDIRMLVIYTADIKPESVKTSVSKTGFSMNIEAAFLSELDSEEIRNRLSDKISKEKFLSDQELMELIILPLTYQTNEKKQEMIKESINLAKKVKDEKQSSFLVAGIVVFSDKIIDADTKSRAKEWMKMTQIGRMFEQEKQDAVNLERAKAIVDKVESVSTIYGDSIDEVCRKMNVSKFEYDAAKAILSDMDNRLVIA